MTKTLKNSLSFVVSLITMFLILIVSFSIFLDKVVLNEKMYIKALKKNDIYTQVGSYINDNIEYLLIESNISSDTLSGEIEPLDKSIYEERVDEKLNAYLRENEMYVGAEFNENLNEFKSNVVNTICSSLQFIDLNALSNSNIIKTVAKLSSIVSGKMFLGIGILSIVLLSGLQFIIWSKRRKVRRYVWIGYPFVSGRMIVLLIGLSGYLSGFYKNIAIGVEYLRNGVVSVMQSYLLNFAYIGLVFMVIGFLFMFIYWKHLFKSYSNDSRVSNAV